MTAGGLVRATNASGDTGKTEAGSRSRQAKVTSIHYEQGRQEPFETRTGGHGTDSRD